MTNFFCKSLFTLKDGLIFIEGSPLSGAAMEEEPEQWVFDSQNGDDWFYFEDSPDSNLQCAKKASTPLTISTRSSTETTLIRFEYSKTPGHKVLHKGRCNFAGLKPVDESSEMDQDHVQARLIMQDL
jgi:hypothetical protein